MRTRSGVCYTAMELSTPSNKRGRRHDDHTTQGHKRIKVSPEIEFFDALPDDLVVSILSILASSASTPADFASLLITCKRLNGLGLHPIVLAKASPKVFTLKAKKWSDSAHHFFKLCAESGNVEACYTLGMIRFYCLQNRSSGASLMAKAAIASHAEALYSLAVIQFNGSGGSKIDKDLRAGVALSARAAFLGHVDALRELGHCLQDGYGVRRDFIGGRRFLLQADAREILSPPEAHPARRFMREWLSESGGEGHGMCSHGECGRPETRRHEFRRCSVCGKVKYCSRACQALDWKRMHKEECGPTEEDGRAGVAGVEFLGVDGGS